MFCLINKKRINEKIKKLIFGVNAKKKLTNNAKNEAKIAPANVVSKKFWSLFLMSIFPNKV